jgi:hypothetical protein
MSQLILDDQLDVTEILPPIRKWITVRRLRDLRLENGRQPNPTVDTLWRYARAIGRRLVLTHTEARAQKRRNHKAVKSARR